MIATTSGGAAGVVGAVAVAAAMWWFLFRVPRGTIWQRSAVAAVVVSGYAVAAAAALGHLGQLLGPVNLTEVAIGVGAGVAWVVATHVGAAVIGRVAPSFVEQVTALYNRGGEAAKGDMAAGLAAMAVAEELLFRGVIQWEAGIVAAVLIYAAVQLVERNWPLVMAGALCGVVWGGLYAWRGGLIAPVGAHLVWTSALAMVWPIKSSSGVKQPAGSGPAGLTRAG